MVQKVNFNNLTGDTLSVGNTTITGTGVTVGGAPLTGGSGGATQYANTASLPKTDLTFGEFALVGNTLFITNGTGWYSVGLINQSPSLSISVSDISLGPNGNTINFTYTATDPDGPEPTVTMTTTANTSQANVTLYTSNSTVTVENLSATDYSANIVLTATDGIDQTFGTVTLNVGYVSALWDETALSIGTSSTNSLDNSTFIDRSTNAQTVTTSGAPVQTAFHPYLDNWSVEFDGTQDYLSSVAIPGYGTSDFTIECFVYLRSLNSVQNFVQQRSDNGPLIRLNASNNLEYFWGAGNNLQTGSTTLSDHQWYHIALVRSSGVAKVYIDGVEELSFSEPQNFPNAQVFIGAYAGVEATDGYISNVRIVNGTALYTSTFTPPTEKLTAVSGTSLLTCQSNRFIDNSSNDYAITVNDNTKVSAYNPFGQGSEYAVGQNKGSYKNVTLGTDSAYVAPHTSKVLVYNEDWTIEFWCYADTFTTQSYIIGKGILTSRQWAVAVQDSILRFYYSTNGSSSGDTTKDISYDFITGQWYHIALVNDGATNTLNYYVNGTSIGTQVLGAFFATNGYGEYIGKFMNYGDANHGFNGYISDLKIDNGNKLYTSAFTPPTSPVGNTNADLYLPFDNAGIFDKTGNHTIELSGDTSTSTTYTKYSNTSAFTDTGGILIKQVPSFDSSDFTIEGWFYPTEVPGTGNAFIGHAWGSGYGSFLFYSSNTLYALYMSGSGSGWDIVAGENVNVTPWTGSWKHFAFTRSGNVIRVFLDGTQTYTKTISGSLMAVTEGTDDILSIGSAIDGTSGVHGAMYVENFQVLKYVAKYTTNFTPPTLTQGQVYQAES